MTNFFTADENNSSDFRAKLARACEGLFYISETDTPIVPFFRSLHEGPLDFATSSTTAGEIEEVSFETFFARLTEERDWYGNREKSIAKRFAELQSLLEEYLRDLKVIRKGRIQIDIYVVGTDADGNTAGFQTKAVET
jgi:hypothetical protein